MPVRNVTEANTTGKRWITPRGETLIPVGLWVGLVGLVAATGLIVWWEARRPPSPPILLCITATGEAEEYLEGRVRLFLWSAWWRGYPAQILIRGAGMPHPLREIAGRLVRTYPYAVTLRSPSG